MRRRDGVSIWPMLMAAVVIGALAAAYYFWQREKSTIDPSLGPPGAQSMPQAGTSAAPAIEHPIERAEVAASPEAMPPSQPSGPLEPPLESGPTFAEALAQAVGPTSFPDYLILDDLVEHIVATIDNLPREKVARRLIPVQPVAGKVVVTGEDAENMVLSADNYARYATYISLLQTLDLQQLAAVYVRYYPLFQQAYAGLGYPQAYFNDRLVAVIDHLLAAPEVSAPLAVVQPGPLYKFADPELEAYSAGHKILLRMGSDNAAIVKARLRELRRLLTQPNSP